MPNLLTVPGLKKVSKLSGWPLVGVIGVALAVIALLYGGWTNSLETSCTVRVQADRTPVLSEPVRSAVVLKRVNRNTEFAVDDSERQRDGFWQIADGGGWIPGDLATSISSC